MRSNSKRTILFKQTIKEIEKTYRDVGNSYDEFKRLCRKSCGSGYNGFCIDRLKREIREDTVSLM